MDDEFPIIPSPRVPIAIVFDLEGPIACRLFIPIVDGGKHPISIIVIRITLFLSQCTLSARWGGEGDDQVTSVDMVNIHVNFDMLDFQSIVYGHCIVDTLCRIIGDGSIDCAGVTRDVNRLINQGPILCHGHSMSSINGSISILVRYIVTRSIDIP